MKAEIITGLSFEDYKKIPALNMSLLKEILDSPGRLDWRRNNPKDVTPAMIRGGGIDSLVTEPERFAQEYVTPPVRPDELPDHFLEVPSKYLGKNGALLAAGKEWASCLPVDTVLTKASDWNDNGLSMKSGAGKAWKAHVEAQGQRVITKAELAHMRGAADSVLSYELSAALVEAGLKQVTFVWQDELTDLWCKGRPDLYIPEASRELVLLLRSASMIGSVSGLPGIGDPIIPDLKSTGVPIQPDSFGRQTWSQGWHRQLGHYCMGALEITGRHHDFASILAVEQDTPYRSEVFALPQSVLDQGREEVRGMLEKYAYWDNRGEWPLSSGKVLGVEFKEWMK